MCGTCGCKSAESGKKNCGCGQDPCITFGAEIDASELDKKDLVRYFLLSNENQLRKASKEDIVEEYLDYEGDVDDDEYDELLATDDEELIDFISDNFEGILIDMNEEELQDMFKDNFDQQAFDMAFPHIKKAENYDDDDEPEMVHCSFCSKIIGTEKEVYDEETIDYEVANGETICVSCGEEREKELKNDLDPHYSPFYAETFEATPTFNEETQEYEGTIKEIYKDPKTNEIRVKGRWYYPQRGEWVEYNHKGCQFEGCAQMYSPEWYDEDYCTTACANGMTICGKNKPYLNTSYGSTRLIEGWEDGAYGDFCQSLTEDVEGMEMCNDCDYQQVDYGAETEKPFWENITMSSKKKKDFSPLYHGLIAGALGVVALKIMDRVKK
tara:strand:+ start:432 stop:1580 length:1149 start_codon:yes stop_codon:yes gene_type:complete